MNRHAYEEYRSLQDSGVKVGKENIGVKYNAGGESETFPHSVCKNLAAHVALLNGYRVDSEVEVVKNKETVGEIDVLIWGHPERTTIAVELESSPKEEVASEKVEKYVQGTAIQDMLLLNLNDCPMHMIEASKWVADELGLEV